jgi:hypothetical protein
MSNLKKEVLNKIIYLEKNFSFPISRFKEFSFYKNMLTKEFDSQLDILYFILLKTLSIEDIFSLGFSLKRELNPSFDFLNNLSFLNKNRFLLYLYLKRTSFNGDSKKIIYQYNEITSFNFILSDLKRNHITKDSFFKGSSSLNLFFIGCPFYLSNINHFIHNELLSINSNFFSVKNKYLLRDLLFFRNYNEYNSYKEELLSFEINNDLKNLISLFFNYNNKYFNLCDCEFNKKYLSFRNLSLNLYILLKYFQMKSLSNKIIYIFIYDNQLIKFIKDRKLKINGFSFIFMSE